MRGRGSRVGGAGWGTVGEAGAPRRRTGRLPRGVAALGVVLAGVLGCAGCQPAAGGGSGAAAARPSPTGATGVVAGRAGSELLGVHVRNITVRAELADTEEERSIGLMGRKSLSPGTGMIFDFDGETTSAFYMFQTLIPLSIMFVLDGRVVSVREMSPCPDHDPSACPTYHASGPYTLAVEASEGTFSTARPGDRVAIAPV